VVSLEAHRSRLTQAEHVAATTLVPLTASPTDDKTVHNASW